MDVDFLNTEDKISVFGNTQLRVDEVLVRLKNCLSLLSPLSYQWFLLEIMHPFALVGIILSSFSFTVIKRSWMVLRSYDQVLLAAAISRRSNCFSLFGFCDALYFEKEIEKVRFSILNIFHRRPLSFKSACLFLNSGSNCSRDSIKFSS